MRVAGPIGAVLAAAAPHGLVDVVSREPNLEDVFLAQYGDHRSAGRRPLTLRAAPRLDWPWSRVMGLAIDLRQDRPGQPSRGPRRGRASAACSCSATAAPFGRSSSRTIGAPPAVHRRHDRAAAGPARPARRADQHRDARRVPRPGASATPCRSSSACGRSSPCRARSPARPRRAASTCSPRRRTSRRSIALQKLAGHVTALSSSRCCCSRSSRGSAGSPSPCCPAMRSRFAAALGQALLYGLADARRRVARLRDGAVRRADTRRSRSG